MVKVKEDLSGRIFSYLTVLEQTDDHILPNGGHQARWLCRCKCGNEVKVTGNHLKSGHTRSCGCITLDDLTGRTFGMLTVIERADNVRNPCGTTERRWRCKCECGNETIVRSCNLKSGGTISCGCYRKLNDAVELDDCVVMYTSKGTPFYVDKDDYEKVKGYCWYDNGNGYLRANTPDGSLYLHRAVTDCPQGLIPDHIKGKESRGDNRKQNLRIGTPTQNMQNTPIRRNNTSGCTGVYWDNARERWAVQITVNKKVLYLGRFEDYDDAVAARKRAESEYFGEWSYDSSQSLPREGARE